MKLKKIHFEFKKPTVGQWIWFGILVLIIAFITYIVIRLIPKDEEDKTQFVYYTYEEPEEDMPKPEYVLDNDKLHFELDASTTHFTVTQKDTGRVWYSNPKDAALDSVALPKEKSYMDSTLLLTYSTENGVNNTYDSSSYSVAKKYYEIEMNGDSIQVNYILGDIERTYILPMALTETRMDEFTEQMKGGDKNLVLQYYRKYDIDNLMATDNEKELLAKYPVLEEDNVYVFRDKVPVYMKERIETIFTGIGYTYADYEDDLKMYSGGTVKNVPMFNISIIYKIDGSNLVVDIPYDKISCKKDYPLTKLAVLPYMGAAGTEDKGFLFVPEGGGALINFNNGKNKQNAYYSDIYGWDSCLNRKILVTETKNQFPVFGISYSDSSFISIIENGASYGGINADISGRYNSYNTVYSSFKLYHSEQYDVSSKSNNAEYIYEESLPEGESITQRYSFVDSGSYVDMANEYSNYLVEKNSLQKITEEEAPVAVEILGAVDKIQQVMGFPKSRPYELTTYKRTGEIIDELSNLGFKNMYVRLTGFLNRGVQQKVLTKTKAVSKLGSKKDFNELIQNQNEKNQKLYIDGLTQYANDNTLADGFSMYRDSARFVSSELARLYDYSTVCYIQLDNLHYLVNPQFAKKMSENLKDFALKNSMTGVSFRDVGKDLSADYNDDRRVSREAVKKMQVEVLDEIKKEKLGVMVQGGNDYILPYADIITNMDLFGNEYLILDEKIPFYEIAIHGYVNYTGKAINIAPYSQNELLKAASYGAGLYYVFMGENTAKLQDTTYTEYYGAGFDSWKEKAQEIYKRYNIKLGKTFTQKIVDFKNVNANVTRTEYEDGTVVYVNYSNEPFTSSEGFLVSAQDYFVENKNNGGMIR